MPTRRRLSRVFKFTIFGFGLHTIFTIICSIGFLIQLILVLINYFSYPVLTNVYLTVPEVTELPDVPVCFDGAYMINWTKALLEHPQFKTVFKIPRSVNTRDEAAIRVHIFKLFDKNQIMRLTVKNLTVRQTGNLFYTKDELFDSVSITNLTASESKDYCEIHALTRKMRYCSVIACSVKKVVTLSNLENAKSSISPNILTIRIKQQIFDYAPNFFITLVPPKIMPRGNLLRWDTMSVYHKEPRFYKMHYFIFERRLLPAPYATNCFDYHTLGYKQSIDMKDSCFNNESMKMFGVPFHASTLNLSIGIPFGSVKYAENQFNTTFRKQLDTIVDTCFKLTERPDCYRKTFIIRPRNPIITTGNCSVIAFGSIKEPNIKVVLEPRLVWVDIIITIGSISGTWFGFSIADHVPLIYRSSWNKVSSWIRFQPKAEKTKTRVIRELQRRASKRLPSIYEHYHSPLGYRNYPRF
uniref:Uncharacterized protein n=1 Tax=Tetranychus urticae TaxID=32264 RepID=T1KJN0_TETUR